MLHRVVEFNRCSLVCHAFLGSSHLKHYVFFIFTFFHEQPELSCVGSGKIYPTPNKMSELPQLLLPQTTLELQKLRSASIHAYDVENAGCLDRYLWQVEDRFFSFANPHVRKAMIEAAIHGQFAQHWIGNAEFYVDEIDVNDFLIAIKNLIAESHSLAVAEEVLVLFLSKDNVNV